MSLQKKTRVSFIYLPTADVKFSHRMRYISVKCLRDLHTQSPNDIYSNYYPFFLSFVGRVEMHPLRSKKRIYITMRERLKILWEFEFKRSLMLFTIQSYVGTNFHLFHPVMIIFSESFTADQDEKSTT